MSEPQTPEKTAKHMLSRYGAEYATEHAQGYAYGVYFKQTPQGRLYWLAVVDELEKLRDA